jgi:sec-independent protein translocase protein TatC
MSTIASELRGIDVRASQPGLAGRVSRSFWQTLVLIGALLGNMSFLDHLEELRRRLIKCAIAVGAGVLICTAYTPAIVRFLKEPAAKYGVELVGYGAWEIFSLYFYVGMASGICLAAPVILFQAWRFIEPALHAHEKRYALPFLTSTTVFFVLGVVFGFAVAAPYILQMESQLAILMGIAWKPSAVEYIGLLSATVVAMGIVFEMPPVIFILSRIGLVDGWFLTRNFRYAFLILAVLAAVLTPSGDIAPMMAFLSVMLGLYAVSIVVAFVFARKGRTPELRGRS